MNKTFTIIMAILLTVLLVVSAFGAEKGTMKKGSWFMAGGWTAGFSSTGGDTYLDSTGAKKRESHFQISPSAGYFFMDGLGVGALISFDHTKFLEVKNTDMAFGPKVYYYIGANKKEVAKGMAVPYGTVSFTYKTGKITVGSGADNEAKTKGYDVMFGVGGVYLLANSVGVFGEVYYDLGSEKSKVGSLDWSKSAKENQFGLKIGVNAFFSFGK